MTIRLKCSFHYLFLTIKQFGNATLKLERSRHINYKMTCIKAWREFKKKTTIQKTRFFSPKSIAIDDGQILKQRKTYIDYRQCRAFTGQEKTITIMNNPAVFRWCPVNSSIRDTNHHTITATAVPNPFVVFKPKKKQNKTKNSNTTNKIYFVECSLFWLDPLFFKKKLYKLFLFSYYFLWD